MAILLDVIIVAAAAAALAVASTGGTDFSIGHTAVSVHHVGVLLAVVYVLGAIRLVGMGIPAAQVFPCARTLRPGTASVRERSPMSSLEEFICGVGVLAVELA